MITDLQHDHVMKRLRLVHVGGIAVITIFFAVFFFLGRHDGADTSFIQMILLVMGLVLGFSYISVLASRQEIPKIPLLFFFILNILTTILVWETGTFRSPFIGIYFILILATSQLYQYAYGLMQTVFGFTGLIFVSVATTNLLLPNHALTANGVFSALYQPAYLMIIYGLIYGMLFLLTVLSSSSTRVVLFRPAKDSELNSTYQEHIIQNMPLGIFVVDMNLRILGNNPAAAAQFPTNNMSNKLTDYLSLAKINPRQTLLRLAKSKEERQLLWKLDTGELRPVTVTVDVQKSKHTEDNTFILFVK